MKKIVMLLLVASLAVMAFADTVTYFSTGNVAVSIAATARDVKTQGKIYRSGTYWKLVGVAAAISDNAAFLAIGSGSTSTASYTAKYDTVIPLVPGVAYSYATGATNNFTLDLDKTWYEQQYTTAKDNRGATLNLQLRRHAYGSAMTNAYLGAIYYKFVAVPFSK